MEGGGDARGSGRAILDALSSLALGLGMLALVAPVGLYQLIHGDDRRYRWLISGPAPFDQFGGGPYQLWLYVSFVLLGTGSLGAGLAGRAVVRRGAVTRGAALTAAACAGVAVLGLLGAWSLLLA